MRVNYSLKIVDYRFMKDTFMKAYISMFYFFEVTIIERFSFTCLKSIFFLHIFKIKNKKKQICSEA